MSRDASWKPVHHAESHNLGGEDPLIFPEGIVVGIPGLDLAYAQPGSLMWLYRMSDSFVFPSSGQVTTPSLLDSSHFDATARNMTYHEENSSPGWSTANRPTLQVIDHAALAAADDGCVLFQRLSGYFSPATTYVIPGASFYHTMEAPVDPGFAAGADHCQTAMCWFKPDPSEDRTLPSGQQKQIMIHGTFAGAGAGGGGGNASGWGIFFSYHDDRFMFYVQSGTTAVCTILGPTGIIYGNWYHVAVAWNGTIATLYHNGVSVGTASWAGGGGGAPLRIGGTTNKYATGGDYFAGGEIDDCAGFDSCLTAAEIAAIFNSSGYGAGQTTTNPRAGSPATDPAATSSVLASGSNARQHAVMAADGSGNTTWELPRTTVYVGGT